MTFQMNASGTYQGDHWYIRPIYLIIAFACCTSQILGKKKNNNFAENSLKIYVRLASCPRRANCSKNNPKNSPKTY
jgi:hypothetical protein